MANTGGCDGEEVVQLYVRDRAVPCPCQSNNCGPSERIAVKKGEVRQVKLTVHAAEDLSHYDEDSRAFAVEPGQFEIQVGASSRDVRLRGVITVE